MEQKIKFIIIGLAALLGVSFIFTIQTISSRQTVMRERDGLKEENSVLAKQVDDGKKDNRRLNDQLKALSDDMQKLTLEKEELSKQYENAAKMRDELIEKLKSMKSQPVAMATPQQDIPQSQEAYWAQVIKEKKDLEIQVDNLRNELSGFKISVDQLQREKGTLELEIANLNREKQDMARQLEYAQKQLDYNKKMMDTISLELVGEKNDKMQIQETLKTIKGENAALRKQLKGLNSHKAELEKKLMESLDKGNTLEKRVGEMDIMVKDKILQIDRLNHKMAQIESGAKLEAESDPSAPSAQPQAKPAVSSVELPPIVVRPQADSSVELKSGEGARVASINRENNFVIINLGQDSGLRVGDSLGVYNQQGRQVASIRIIEVRKNISACDIIQETSPIKVNDSVK